MINFHSATSIVAWMRDVLYIIIHTCLVNYYVLLAGTFAAVIVRPEFNPEYWYLAFFSDGFNICINKDERHFNNGNLEKNEEKTIPCSELYKKGIDWTTHATGDHSHHHDHFHHGYY